jgi:hypothetical protein
VPNLLPTYSIQQNLVSNKEKDKRNKEKRKEV